MYAAMMLSVLASIVAAEGLRPEPQPRAKLVPLINISLSTAPAGELKLAPSVLVALSKRLDLQISPLFKVGTKEGSASVNLARPSEGSAWSAGGGFVLSVLHPVDGPGIDCDRDPTNPVCEAQMAAKKLCDDLLAVKAEEGAGAREYKCTKDPQDERDKLYCRDRPQIGDNVYVDPEVMCARARESYERFIESHERRYPMLQIYAGALFGPRKYEYLQDSAGALAKADDTRLTTTLMFGLVSVTGVGLPRLPLTVELSAGYRARATPSKTPARWCEDKGSLPLDGGGSAAVQSCTDGLLGPPSQSKLLSATLLLGGTDIVSERWRFAAGPEFSHDLVTRRNSLALRVPFTFRLTPSTSGSGYLGEYKGSIRITPTFAVEFDSDTRLVGSRVLLMFDLLGAQDLFGSPLAGL